MLGLLASLLLAAPASAFTAPVLYVRLAQANSIDHTPASGWMPLSAAPRLNWLGGYEIGYAYEEAPGQGATQHAALQVTGVPDGHPTQPVNTPFSSGGPGTTIGTIVPVGVEVQFERNATIKPEGSVTGRLLAPLAALGGLSAEIAEHDFVRRGAWTCVARGSVGGIDDNVNSVVFGTPWSAPLRFDVRSDFRRSQGEIFKPRSKHPLLRFTAEFPEAATGGTGRLKLQRLVRCRGARSVFSTVGTFKGRFDAKGRATVKVHRVPPSFYLGTLSFSGTRFYTKSVDPNPATLESAYGGELGYISPLAFPQCPGAF